MNECHMKIGGPNFYNYLVNWAELRKVQHYLVLFLSEPFFKSLFQITLSV